MSTSDDRINIVAQFTAKEGSEADLAEAIKAFLPQTLAEEGCERFELNQSRDNPRVLTIIERFRDQAAFDSHAEAPYIKDFLDHRVPELVDETSVIFYKQIG